MALSSEKPVQFYSLSIEEELLRIAHGTKFLSEDFLLGRCDSTFQLTAKTGLWKEGGKVKSYKSCPEPEI